MSVASYLTDILRREFVDTSSTSPVRRVCDQLAPMLSNWGGSQLGLVSISGSFAKGTANRSSTDIDLFISVRSDTTGTLRELYNSLHNRMQQEGFAPSKRNVAIKLRCLGYDVDLVPGRQQPGFGSDHSLWKNRTQTWTKTNIGKHISIVRNSHRADCIRLMKIWRDQNKLEFPSLYLELSVIRALSGNRSTSLGSQFGIAMSYLRENIRTARIIDPANTANILSDELNQSQKTNIYVAASSAMRAEKWEHIIK